MREKDWKNEKIHENHKKTNNIFEGKTYCSHDDKIRGLVRCNEQGKPSSQILIKSSRRFSTGKWRVQSRPLENVVPLFETVKCFPPLLVELWTSFEELWCILKYNEICVFPHLLGKGFQILSRVLAASASTSSPWTSPLGQLRAPDLSAHCRTSTASSRSQRAEPSGRAQWALPDFKRQISVGNAGPQPRQWGVPELNCELRSSAGTAGLQARAPDLSGHCRASTARARSQGALFL